MSFRIALADWWSQTAAGERPAINLSAKHITVALRRVQTQSMSVGERKRTMIKINQDVLCHTNIKNLNTITEQEKRRHINANCLFVSARGWRRVRDAVWGMGNGESNGRNFSNLAPYWFLLLCPLTVAWQENQQTSCMLVVMGVLTWADGKRQRGREEVVKQADVSIKLIYGVNCLKKKRFSHDGRKWSRVKRPCQQSWAKTAKRAGQFKILINLSLD